MYLYLPLHPHVHLQPFNMLGFSRVLFQRRSTSTPCPTYHPAHHLDHLVIRIVAQLLDEVPCDYS
jgi:hypothetical protein